MERQNQLDCIQREAEDYVSSVMSSQPPAATLRTPGPSGRKRSLSTSAVETEVKKHKGDGHGDGRQRTRTKRSLLQQQGERTEERSDGAIGDLDGFQSPGSGSGDTGRGRTTTEGCGRSEGSLGRTGEGQQLSQCRGCDSDSDIKKLLRKLSDDMVTMHSALNQKIDMIENRIEQSERKITDRVTDRVTKIIDKRVNTEVARLRKEVDDRLQGLREDFNRELLEVNDRLDSERRENTNTGANDGDRRLRVVVLNLPETVNEDVTQKVDAVIRDGLKVTGVRVQSAERKESRSDARPGVVIATFRNSEEKKRVMAAKRALRSTSQYRNVYINHDLSREERNMASNMRTLLDGVRRGQNLQVRGTRIVASGDAGSRDGRRDGSRERRDERERPSEGRGYGSRDVEQGSEKRQNEGRRAWGSGRGNGQREATRQFSRNDSRYEQNQRDARRH